MWFRLLRLRGKNVLNRISQNYLLTTKNIFYLHVRIMIWNHRSWNIQKYCMKTNTSLNTLELYLNTSVMSFKCYLTAGLTGVKLWKHMEGVKNNISTNIYISLEPRSKISVDKHVYKNRVTYLLLLQSQTWNPPIFFLRLKNRCRYISIFNTKDTFKIFEILVLSKCQ